MQAIRACVAETVRRDLKEPVGPVEKSQEERVTFRWRRFLLLTYLVVTASTAQLCLMTQDEIRERKLREAQETRNRLRSANQEQQAAGTRKTPQPETFTHSDPSDHRSRFGSVQTTTNGRLGDADLKLSASYRTESVSRECIPGMDDVSVIWSTLESKDGPGRHSGEYGADNRSSASTTRLQQMANKTETFFGCSRFPLCKRVVYTSHTMESRVSPSTHSCSTAQTMAEQAMVLDSRISCNTTGATIPTGTASASFVFWHHGSGSTTGDRSNVSRQKIKVSKAVRVLQDTMQKI